MIESIKITPIKVGDIVYRLHTTGAYHIAPLDWEEEHITELVVVKVCGKEMTVFNPLSNKLSKPVSYIIFQTKPQAKEAWIKHLNLRLEVLQTYRDAIYEKIMELEDEKQ